MSFKVHLIHDLNYGFNEPTEAADLELPDCDLVILNGNLAQSGKRSIYYSFELCSRYPNIQFIFNEGYNERYLGQSDKWEYEHENNMSFRAKQDAWPQNLHWKDPRSPDGLEILLQTGQTISVWPAFGFPNVVKYNSDWEDTWFYCNICEGQIPVYKLESDILPGTDLKIFGDIDKWASEEFIKQKYTEQHNMIRDWETKQIADKYYGILVTHISPYNDVRLEGISYTGYNIHLHNRIWATTHINKKVNYVGADLVSNPGRGSGPRGKVLEVD
tara:strand:- start:635 stop:1453 length:819 start_codon:yes stop_codon:yes gene_type:complete